MGLPFQSDDSDRETPVLAMERTEIHEKIYPSYSLHPVRFLRAP